MSDASSFLPIDRERLETCLKWTRWFSWACLAGGILLCATLILIPFGGFAFWQYWVLKNATESLESVLKRNDPRDLVMALEGIGFQFLIQIIGMVAGLALSVLFLIAIFTSLGLSLSQFMEPGALEAQLRAQQVQHDTWQHQ